MRSEHINACMNFLVRDTRMWEQNQKRQRAQRANTGTVTEQGGRGTAKKKLGRGQSDSIEEQENEEGGKWTSET